MHICFLMLSHWSGNLGGAEVQVRYLMDYIQENTPHDLSYVCRHSSMSEDCGVTIHRVDPVRPLSRWLKSVDYWAVRRALERLAPDVVYTRVSSPYVGFAADYCRRHRRRHVHHLARIDDVTRVAPARWRRRLTGLERPIYEYGLRRAHAVVAQARYHEQLLLENYGLRAAAVIPNFHPVPDDVAKTAHPLRVLWVANLKADKRPELFIDLAEACADLPDVEFILVGALQDPGYHDVAQRIATRPNVRYLGHLPLREVNSLMERSHVFVNTSRPSGEGFPNTFIQAWMRRVPVVSLEVDPDGLLDRGDIGTCANGSVTRLRDQVRDLIQNRVRAEELGRRARTFAIRTYGMPNCRRVVDLLEGRVDGSPGAAR